jgi:glycosyltransferase involved in cell wall biosynthesis
MLSFIVPAHNEDAVLGRTLDAIHECAQAAGQSYELIVVDDASTDATAEIARQKNAKVVSVNHRQISATRNSGGRAAQGERLFFIDADTTLNPRVLAAALRAFDRGAIGGGTLARFEPPVPLYAHVLMAWLGVFMRIGSTAPGACMFCTRDAFLAVGGFNEKLFGAEDAAFSLALRREGRFVILWPHVRTSGRRVRGVNGLKMIYTLIRMGFYPNSLRSRKSVETLWYDSNRTQDDSVPKTLLLTLANFLLLAFLLLMIVSPIMEFLPWSLTPRDTLLGEIRWAIAITGCHLCLMFWPCIYFLLRALPFQRHWSERIRTLVLLAICLFFGITGTREVILFWVDIARWIFGA